jgi:hypothetical protein
MCESKVEAPVRLISIAEVEGWFPAEFQGKLHDAAIYKLTSTIDFSLKWAPISDDLGPVRIQLAQVSKAAKALKNEIALLFKVGGELVETNIRLNSLNNEIDLLLQEAPGRPNGSPPNDWNGSVARWAPIVASCIQTRNNKPPSIFDPSGPVCVVLAQALKRVYGLEYDATTIVKAVQRRVPGKFKTKLI